MPLAEDRTAQYIRLHLSDFFCIDVLEILSHLPCLTAADQDKLRAYLERHGNRDSVWKLLYDHLPRRTGWVTCLITALRECEQMELAETIANVYASNQTRFQNRLNTITTRSGNQQVSPNVLPPPLAEAPGPHRPARGSPSTPSAASLPEATYNGHPEDLEGEEEKDSHAFPIQETLTLKHEREVPGAVLIPARSGDTSRNPQSSPGLAASSSAPAPPATALLSGGSGDRPPAPASLPSARGPLSPSVSFVPHSTKKAGPKSGSQSPPSPLEAASPSSPQATTSSRGKENQPTTATPIQAPGLPASSQPYTGIPGPQQVPPSVPRFPSPPHPAQTSQVSLGPGPSGRAPPSYEEAAEMSKPEVLRSCGEQPYSGGSERLLISSSSGSMGSLHISSSSGNLPEENDYSSVTIVPPPGRPEASGSPTQLVGSQSPSPETFVVHVEDGPDQQHLHGSSPGLQSKPSTAAQPGGSPKRDSSWGVWAGSAVVVALFSVALAFLYKRIQK